MEWTARMWLICEKLINFIMSSVRRSSLILNGSAAFTEADCVKNH